jgi:hypothetical protein
MEFLETCIKHKKGLQILNIIVFSTNIKHLILQIDICKQRFFFISCGDNFASYQILALNIVVK